MKIRYLTNKKINKSKWNICIDNAENGLIYAYSWYLDILAKNWSGLIADDYTAVMPLIWNKKYGIKYIYQPVYLQQVGIFSLEKLTEKIIEEFIKQIPKTFRHVNMNLNFANKSENLNLAERINYELDLSGNYSELYKSFSKNTRRNIRKAEKNNLILSHNISVDALIKFKKENTFVEVENNIFERFKKIINYCNLHKKYKLYVVKNDKNQIISASFFMLSHNRIYYIMAVSSKEGKEKGASFYIVNEFIKNHAGENFILDFEGSNIPGIARFFASWGAKPVLYFNYTKNNLPNFLRLIKK